MQVEEFIEHVNAKCLVFTRLFNYIKGDVPKFNIAINLDTYIWVVYG